MNAGKQPILVMEQECNYTAAQARDQLVSAGYIVDKSFDLNSALSSRSNCGCQMIVLLVYGQSGPPVTLIFDGTALRTSIFLENDPDRLTRHRFISILSRIPGVLHLDDGPTEETVEAFHPEIQVK